MRKNSCSYPVEFISDAFGEDSRLAELFSGSPRILLVADQNVAQRVPGLGAKIGRYVQAHGLALAGSPLILPGGERVKCDGLKSASAVAAAALEAHLGVNDVVLALGGGTVLDVAGFAAAQVRGGIRLVRMPTTPAAMAGATYAESAAINLSSVKDALRVSSAPWAVILDTTLAGSVLDGVWRSGMGEFVRLAVSADAAFLKVLESRVEAYAAREETVLGELVRATVTIREKKSPGEFSLWVAHRLEAVSGYKIPHGYAVSIALLVELYAAVRRGVMKESDAQRVLALLKSACSTEGLLHSRHLLQDEENLLLGLDAWKLSHPEGVPCLAGLGKVSIESEPDRAAYRAAFGDVRNLAGN